MMRGVTRAHVMSLCRRHGLPLREDDFYLTQVCKTQHRLLGCQHSTVCSVCVVVALFTCPCCVVEDYSLTFCRAVCTVCLFCCLQSCGA
jgi:hypothetical protein